MSNTEYKLHLHIYKSKVKAAACCICTNEIYRKKRVSNNINSVNFPFFLKSQLFFIYLFPALSSTTWFYNHLI